MPSPLMNSQSQPNKMPWKDRPLRKIKWYEYPFLHRCSQKGCLRIVHPRKGDGPVCTLCDKHRMGVATATSKMLDKWWNRDIVENSDPQPTSRNGLVLQEVQQGMPPKSAKDAVEDAHQRRIEVIQEHQRQMQEVEAGKERRKIQEKLRKRRETSVAIATQVKLGRFSAGCQTRCDIFNSL